MGIENFKRWHWIIVGLIVGLVIAYANTNTEPNTPPSVQFSVFDRNVTLDDVGETLHLPRIRDIVLYPPIPASQAAYGKPLQLVTFQLANYDRKARGWRYVPMAMEVDLPFNPPGDENYDGSFENYLKSMKEDYPFVTYEVAWWKAPKAQYGLWMLGCVLVIGGIWPTIQNLLIGAGFGSPKKKETYDLNRFGKYKEPTAKPVEKRSMTSAEHDQLSRLTQNLESELAPTGSKMNVGINPVANTDQPIRKLDSKPLEVAQITTEEEEKEYKGEYYPVAKPTAKKEET